MKHFKVCRNFKRRSNNPPRIIDGENYENNLFSTDEITINIFNIAKLNSDSKVEDGKPARIKRLHEVLGESYFEYLKNLSDLCIFMDESHHYHADKSFEVINELKPILGVELTATPQIQKNNHTIKFKNVVYEYSLAHALKDEKFVKIPAVVTRKNFNPAEFSPEQLDREKLIDGIKLHEDTKNKLAIYAQENKKFSVKPFVLVVAKNTEHSKELLEIIQSKDFFGGRYADKVIEINSSLRGAEKDSNIEQILSLESPENKIEIVIHVNMLKEGWDVTNLYTIVPLIAIPLNMKIKNFLRQMIVTFNVNLALANSRNCYRTSASETLTEQTIGRGLRLPYGERTGVEEVDRLSIVSHDRYAEIISLANDPNSLVNKIYFIDDEISDDGKEKEVIASKSKFEEFTQSENFVSEIATDIKHEKNFEIAEFIAKTSARTVENLNRQVKNFDAINDSDTQKFLTDSIAIETAKNFSNVNETEIKTAVKKSVESCVKNLTENIIPIPRAVIQPTATIKQKFHKFSLDTKNIYWKPADENLLGTELIGGKNFEIKSEVDEKISDDKIASEIVRRVSSHENIGSEKNLSRLQKILPYFS